MASISDSAFGGITPDQFANFAPTALTGVTGTQIGALDPASFGAIGSDQLGSIPLDAIGNVASDQIQQLDREAVGGLTPDQFQTLDPTALGGFDRTNLGGLDEKVIGQLDPGDINDLDATEVQNLPPEDALKLLTNVDGSMIAPSDVADLLPQGVNLNQDTGQLEVDPGTPLVFRAIDTPPTDGLDPSQAPDGVALPTLPDLSSNLSVGGGATGASVLDGLDNALDAADAGTFSFTQTDNGILNVVTDAAPDSPVASFIPDSDNMVQAPEGASPGISQDDRGAFVLTTDQGYQIPLLPAPVNPDGIADLLPDSDISVDKDGATTISNPEGDGSNPIVGVFDPMVQTSDQAPGVYRSGSGADEQIQVVYSDGTAQTMKPSISSADEFTQAASEIPGVSNVEINTDGSININYQGSDFTLIPLFDVEAGTADGTMAPSLTVEGDRFFFTNSNGDKQEFVLST